MSKGLIFYTFAGIMLSGCATVGLPGTPGEKAAAYGYVPLDPLPVDQVSGSDSCTEAALATGGTRTASPTVKDGTILAKLPDQTIRFAVATFDQTKGSLTFGPATLTSKGGQYKAVLDYIQADAVPVIFYIRKLVQVGAGGVVYRAPSDPSREGERVIGYEVITSAYEGQEFEIANLAPGDRSAKRSAFLAAELEKYTSLDYQQVTIPVYVGVGLRLSADVLSLEGA